MKSRLRGDVPLDRDVNRAAECVGLPDDLIQRRERTGIDGPHDCAEIDGAEHVKGVSAVPHRDRCRGRIEGLVAEQGRERAELDS